MAIPTTASKVIAVATREANRRVKESPFGSNKQKYGVAYGMNGVAWCGIYMWWVFKKAGFDLRKITPTQYTPTFRAGLVEAGWPEVEPSEAKAGDLVFFDFPDSVHRIQHVGLCIGRNRYTLLTNEGNTGYQSDANGGMVMERQRNVGLVAAVIRPPYKTKGKFTLKRILKLGSKGADVKVLQRLVRVAPDGVFGPRTYIAVKDWQRKHGLVADAQFGPKSAAKAGWLFKK